MEAAPPSYGEATLKDVWIIIAERLSLRELLSGALVCKNWHGIFAPLIWGEPSAHFGVQDGDSQAALTTFRSVLKYSRREVRHLTHTLRIPAAQSELYDGPEPYWLWNLLERLPRLRCLIVQGVSFFDHDTLQVLASSRARPQRDDRTSDKANDASFSRVHTEDHADMPHWYNLRFLDASRCPNISPSSLAAALRHFDDLLVLDLSFSKSACSPIVWRALDALHNLQVLKLQGCGLRDEDIIRISESIKLRVRILDVRDNDITDVGVQALTDTCIKEHIPPFATQDGIQYTADRAYASLSAGSLFNDPNLDIRIQNALTSSAGERLTIEDATLNGITHLRLDGNPVPYNTIRTLLEAESLCCLSCGNVKLTAGREKDALNQDVPRDHKYRSNISYLRVDHAFITSVSKNCFDIAAASFPQLRSLELIKFPRRSAGRDVINAIIRFISSCAYEAHIARECARTFDSGKPQHHVSDLLGKQAKQYFALERLVLELDPDDLITEFDRDIVQQQRNDKWSVTEDRDSDAFLHASMSDFSFFDAEKERRRKSSVSVRSSASGNGAKPLSTQTDVIDNVVELSNWRRERKSAHEQDVKVGGEYVWTEGFWDGVIQVVHPSSDRTR